DVLHGHLSEFLLSRPEPGRRRRGRVQLGDVRGGLSSTSCGRWSVEAELVSASASRGAIRASPWRQGEARTSGGTLFLTCLASGSCHQDVILPTVVAMEPPGRLRGAVRPCRG